MRLLDDKPGHTGLVRFLPFLAVPNKEEQNLGPYCMYTKPACCLQVGCLGLECNSGICFSPWDVSELQSACSPLESDM